MAKRNKLEPTIRSLVIKVCEELNQMDLTLCILDVGANIGLYTWEISKICPKIRILSFEPDPNNFELLQMTHEAGGLQNVKLYSFALSNESNEKDFRTPDELTSATGSFFDDETLDQTIPQGKSKKIKGRNKEP